MFRAPVVALLLLALVTAQPAAGLAGAPVAETPPTVSESTSDAVRLTDAAAANGTTGTAGPTLGVDTVLSLTPETAGSIGVVQTFSTPEEVTELRVTLDPQSTVTESEGFSQVDRQTWAWDGETASPRLVYEMAANRTTDSEGPLATDGQYLYADTGPWALVRTPNIGLQWRYRGTEPVSVDESTRVDGEGAVGGTTAFLGPHEVYTRTVADQEIRLVVPADAELADSPERVLDGLANASRSLQVGDRDPTVFAVAAPTNQIDWGVQGIQLGEYDFWVRANQPIDEVGSTWLHEYVHTRQGFSTATSGRWFTEASATYYAALLSVESEGVRFSEFSQFLGRGAASPQDGSVLADPTDWANNANYWKGALVLGEVDRRMRLATDGGSTLQRVLAKLNGRTEPVTNEDILTAVSSVSTAQIRETATRFTTTSEAPEMWDSSAHNEAFGGDTALLRVGFDPETDVRATGPYRNVSLQQPVVLATGETLAVRTDVENLGGAPGTYDVTLRVNDEAVDSENGTLGANERTTVSLTNRFTSAGSYTVSIAGERFTVSVRQSATPRLTNVTVDKRTVDRDDEVIVTATVENTETVPGNTTVAFTRSGEVVRNETVTVGPGEQKTVTATVTMPEAGTHQVGVGDQTVDVRVEEPATGTATASTTAATTTSTTSPGFGVLTALVAVVAASSLKRRFADSEGGDGTQS